MSTVTDAVVAEVSAQPTPDDLLKVTPVTTINEVLPYSERTMRVIADTALSYVNTMEPRSVFIRKFLQTLEPWDNVSVKLGKMTKRIPQYLFDEYKAALPERMLSGIGNFLAQEAPAGEFHYDITDQLLWNAGDFGDHNACFLSSRSDVPSAFMEEGGRAMRYWTKAPNYHYNGVDGYKGNGRAWVMPTPVGLPVLFNAYGVTIDQYASRLKIILPGVPTTLVGLSNLGSRSGHVYINGGIGLLIGDDSPEFSKEVDLKVYTGRDRPVLCPNCGRRTLRANMFNVTWPNHHYQRVCNECVGNYCGMDVISGEYVHTSLLAEFEYVGQGSYDNRGHRTALLLRGMAEPFRIEDAWRCEQCSNIAPFSSTYVSVDGNSMAVCDICADDEVFIYECHPCGRYLKTDEKCSCGRQHNTLRFHR